MASGSKTYQRIRRELYAIVETIPYGKVMSVAALSSALNIPSRHVAYMLSQMKNDEREILPWFRVVPQQGKLPKTEKRTQRHARQITLLRSEGVCIDDAGQVQNFDQYVIDPPMTHSETIWADQPDD